MAQRINDGSQQDELPATFSEVHCHRHGIPDALARKIDLRYGALYSSVLQLQLSGKLNDEVWTYQAQTAGLVHSIFLYQRQGPEIRVLNEQIVTAASDIVRFIEEVFERHSEVNRIAFFGIDTGKLETRRPYQRFFCAEDIVIPGYGSDRAYADGISKTTKRNIRRKSAALAESHPTSRFEILEANAITSALVARIIGFNRVRMARKYRTSTYHDEDAERLAQLASHGGMAGLISLDGEIVAGTVCARFGNCFYMLASGHDSELDPFSLGLLCCYWTAQECLRRGALEINLMGGRLPYKYSLLGRSRKYDTLCFYRTRTAMLHNILRVIDMGLHGSILEAKFALLDCEREDGAAAQLVTRGIRAWRAAKVRHARAMHPSHARRQDGS